jgi:peptidylprolyl isomerase
VKRSFIALGAASFIAICGAAALAQSSAPPLRVVPMGENERPATKAAVKKTPAKAAATKTATTKAPATKAAATKAPPARTPSPTAARTTATKAAPTRTMTSQTPRPTTAASASTARTAATAPPRTTTIAAAPKAKAAVATPVVPARAPVPPSAPVLRPVAQVPPTGLSTSTPAPNANGPLLAVDWRPLDPENAIMYETTKGRVIVELAPELAPGHVARIKELVREGFYNGLAFHRVIDTFMAQGGDPKGDGTGGSDKPNLRGEFNFRRGADTSFVRAVDRGGAALGWVRTVPVTSQPDILMDRTADKRVAAWANHCPGVTSMARAEDENSANSQFFLMRAAYPSLDRRYTVWGRAVIGLDVIRALKVGEPVAEPDKMVTVRVLADIPEAERPRVMIQRTDGPMFKARLAAALEEKGAAFSNCDLAPEGRIVP